MNSVRIITDSSVELSPAEADALGIRLLPLRYSVDNTVYRQDVDISSEKLLELVLQDDAAVVPLPPAREDISNMLENVARSGQVALCVHVADGVVPLAEPLRTVAQDLFGRARIEIVDSQAISYGLQRIVRAAAHVAAEGGSLGDVTQAVRAMLTHIYTLFYAEDFEHLERSVDIQPAQAMLAAILGVKPLLMLEEGRLLPLEKVTPRATPVDKLADFVFEFSSVAELAILLGPRQPDFDVNELRQRLIAQYPELEIPLLRYGPLVAASIGPGATGLFVYEGLQAGW